MTTAKVSLSVLKSELQNDPRGYGYNAAVRNDTLMAQIIDTIRDGTNPPATPTAAGGSADGHITVDRVDVTPMELLSVIDVRDFISNANNLQAAWMQSVMLSPTQKVTLANPDGTKSFIRQNIDRAVNNTQGSQTRLDAVAVRFGSRAEELFGQGVTVTSTDVGQALNS